MSEEGTERLLSDCIGCRILRAELTEARREYEGPMAEEIQALKQELAEAKADADRQAEFHMLWKAKVQDVEEQRNLFMDRADHAEKERAEAHAAIRDMDTLIGLASIRPQWLDIWRIKHLPAIRRAMGEGINSANAFTRKPFVPKSQE